MRTVVITFCILLLTYGLTNAQPGVQFIEDQESFEGACPGLSFEDFEDTNIPPNNFVGCDGLLNSLTDNECYSPGAVIPGFSLGSVGLDFITVLTPPRFDILNVAAGPETSRGGVITFTESVNSVGMVLVDPRFELSQEIRVFGEDDVLLATETIVIAIDIGTFLGVISKDEPITRIEFDANDFRQSILLYELSFGLCDPNIRPIPTLSEWGLIAMAGVLGLVGLLALRRKKAAA